MDIRLAEVLNLPVMVCIAASGGLLMTGLLTGLWKFFQMWRSREGLAHPYVDIAHRASLMYSFAALVLAALSALSAWSVTVNLYAVLLPLAYFYAAVVSYIIQGALNGPDNQLRQPHRIGSFAMPRAALGAFMATLAVAEIGGVAVLLAGFARNPLWGQWLGQ